MGGAVGTQPPTLFFPCFQVTTKTHREERKIPPARQKETLGIIQTPIHPINQSPKSRKGKFVLQTPLAPTHPPQNAPPHGGGGGAHPPRSSDPTPPLGGRTHTQKNPGYHVARLCPVPFPLYDLLFGEIVGQCGKAGGGGGGREYCEWQCNMCALRSCLSGIQASILRLGARRASPGQCFEYAMQLRRGSRPAPREAPLSPRLADPQAACDPGGF